VTNLESDCVSRCMHFTKAFILQVKMYFYNCSKTIELVYVRNSFKYFDVNSYLFVDQFPVFKSLFVRSSLDVCMYVCMYVCIYYICMYVYMCVYVLSMYVLFMYVCV
jgi:hypothetical protein